MRAYPPVPPPATRTERGNDHRMALMGILLLLMVPDLGRVQARLGVVMMTRLKQAPMRL